LTHELIIKDTDIPKDILDNLDKNINDNNGINDGDDNGKDDNNSKSGKDNYDYNVDNLFSSDDNEKEE
jgi:hypothetical protein